MSEHDLLQYLLLAIAFIGQIAHANICAGKDDGHA